MVTKPVSTVENVLQILEFLSERDAELGVRELSRRTGLSVPTAHRLCFSMEQLGLMVQRPDTQRYSLGPRLVQLAASILAQLDVRRTALPRMQRLRDHYGETITLSVLHGEERLSLDQVLSPRDPIVSVQVGVRHKLVRGSAGKALLAFLPEDHARAIIGSDWSDLEPDLRIIRSRGYSESSEELLPGVVGISAPVFDHTGGPAAAISIVASTARVPLPFDPHHCQALLEAAREVSLELGCPLFRLPGPLQEAVVGAAARG